MLELTSVGYLLTQQLLNDSQQVMLIHSNGCLAELLQAYGLRLVCQGLSKQKIKKSQRQYRRYKPFERHTKQPSPTHSQPTVFATSDDLTPWSGL
ncbi:hypothetical protein [Moraxella veridica]|uniref:Uncharacterized protein n=1 Tax=Moraxella catarrhalis TaxID=480 RepID=A0A7Z0UWB0_MORCA|nr:hypothetical protein [Moraxella catarrhalis]OAU98792.1 hypothetical protein AO382_2303 [Moraxella catarrhalis]